MADEYYLQNCSAGYIGDFPVFWHKTNSGYTPYIDDAKVFTRAEADEVMRSTQGTHSWATWPVATCQAAATRVVSIERLRRLDTAEQAVADFVYPRGDTGPVGIPGPLGPIDTGLNAPAGPADRVAEFKKLGLDLVPVATGRDRLKGWQRRITTGAYPWKENESPNRVERIIGQFWLDISHTIAREVKLAAENSQPAFTTVSDLTVVVQDGLTWAYVYMR